MRNVAVRGFALLLLLALTAFAVMGPARVMAESNGSGGTPFPRDTASTVSSSTSTLSSSGLSAAQLLDLYLSLL